MSFFILSFDFRLVIKCKLFVCLVELVWQNMKDLGSIDKKKCQIHWAMELRGGL